MLTSLSRLLNLKRIADLYGLLREYIENPKNRNPEHLRKMWDKLKEITEFKELIARERMDALKGNKTYIVAAIAGLATAAKTLGYIDEGTYQSIMGFLVALGTATMAAKVNRNTEIGQQTLISQQVQQSQFQMVANQSSKSPLPTGGFASAGFSQRRETNYTPNPNTPNLPKK